MQTNKLFQTKNKGLSFQSSLVANGNGETPRWDWIVRSETMLRKRKMSQFEKIVQNKAKIGVVRDERGEVSEIEAVELKGTTTRRLKARACNGEIISK